VRNWAGDVPCAHTSLRIEAFLRVEGDQVELPNSKFSKHKANAELQQSAELSASPGRRQTELGNAAMSFELRYFISLFLECA
jgi:hypothetical protein